MRSKYLGIGIALLVAVVGLALFSPFVTDDAFISLRYARHLAEGYGIVWNRGEAPVEGYSNFLHVMIAAAAIRLDLPPIGVLRGINWLSALGIVVLLHRYAARVTKVEWLPSAAAVIIAAHVPLAFWAASGLETALYSCLCLLAVLLFLSPRTATRRVSSLAFLLAALTRPEGVLFFAAAATVALSGDRRAFLRSHGVWLLAFALPYGIYTLWRLLYFGALFPTSVLYKAGAFTPGVVVMNFARDLPFLIPLALLAPFWRRGRAGVIPVLLIGSHLAIFWNVSPVVAHLHRFLVPLVPFAVVLAVIALDELPGRLRQTRLRAALRAVPVIGLLAWALVNPFTGVSTARSSVLRLGERMAGRMKLADVLHARLTVDATIAIGDVGIVGYLLENPILDAFGLNSREFADGSPVQRYAYWATIPRRAPDAIALVSRTAGEFRPRYLLGRIALQHPESWKDYSEDPIQLSAGPGYVYWVHFRPQTSAVRDPPLPRHFGDVCRDNTVRCIEPLRRKLGGSQAWLVP